MAPTMGPSSVLERYKAVSGCIVASYQHQLEVFRRFSENKCLKRQLRTDAVRSTVHYLSWDLMDIRQSIKKRTYWSIRCDEEETIILENYLNDLCKMSILLGESARLDVNNMIDNVSTAEYVMSQSIIVLLENISSVPNEFVDIDSKFLDIVNETGYAFQKFMIFTVTHLHVEDSFSRYKKLSGTVLSQLKTTIFEFKDEILVVEFIYYTKRSLQFLYKYLVRVVPFMVKDNSSKEIEQLQSIIAHYTKSYISIISKALNAENPINNMLDSFDKLEDEHLAMLEEISSMMESNSTDNGPNGLTYNIILFFTEIIQNIISIDEFGKGFRISNK